MHGLRLDTENTKRIIRWLMEEWNLDYVNHERAPGGRPIHF